MNNIDVQVEGDNIPILNPGCQLAKLREMSGYTLTEVAERLKLRINILEDIEHDNYNSIRHSVFIKGYIRSYAKFLAVDPKPYVESYIANFNDKDPKIENIFKQSIRKHTDYKKMAKFISLSGMLLLSLITGLWYYKFDYMPSASHKSFKAKKASKTSEITQPYITESLLASDPDLKSLLGQ